MSGLPTLLRPRGGKLDAQALRAYCEQGAAQGETAQLYQSLLDLVEQRSERRLRLGRVRKAQFGRRSEQLEPSQLQLALAGLDGMPSAVQALSTPVPPSPETPPPPRKPSRLQPPRQIPESYLYTNSWRGKPIRKLLGEFEGLLQSDSYSGLQKLFENNLKAIRGAGCMAHARRHFVQALDAGDAHAAIRSLRELEG